jgi:two-component system, NtrC family, nitrogen regulation sensor histidine kinase NtrY
VPALAAALLVVLAAGALHGHWVRRAWPRSAEAWTAERVKRLRDRQAELTSLVQGAARSLAALPESRAALKGPAAERSPLFARLAERHEASRRSFPEPMALAVHRQDPRPIAWAGRVGSAPDAGRAEPHVNVHSGRITTALAATAPIRGGDGEVLGVASAELPIAVRRHIRNAFLFDFDLLSEGDEGVELRYEAGAAWPAPVPGAVEQQGLLEGPDGRLWASFRVVAPALAAEVDGVRRPYAAVAILLATGLLLAWIDGARRQGRLRLGAVVAAAAGWRLLLSVIPLPFSGAAGELASPAVYASAIAGPLPAPLARLTGSPLDLFLTAAVVSLVALWLLRTAVAQPGRLPAAASPLADAAGLLVIAFTFVWVADVSFESALELDTVSLLPRRPALAALQAALLLITLTGAMLAAAVQCVVARRPLSRVGQGGRLASSLAVGALAIHFWPRPVFGLPLVPAAVLFIASALLATGRERGVSAWQRAPASVRAGLLLAAAVAAQLVLHPSLVHYGEKNRRQQIENDYAPLVRRQPQWREQLMAAALDRIDSLHVSPGAPARGEAGVSELAFAVWSETDLAAHGFASAVEIQDATGAVVSRFALNLPSVSTGPLPLPTTDSWDVRWDALQLVSARRPVRHAQRRVTDNGRLQGAIHVYVGDDFWNLGFLEGRDPYPTLFRTAAARSRRDRPVHLVAYDEERMVTFSSADRPPGLTDDLVARLHAEPHGFWTTVPFGPVLHHALFFDDQGRAFGLSFPRIGPARYASNLVEAAAGTALAGVVILLLILAARSLAGCATFSLHTMVGAMLGRFSLRLFVAFVALAVASVAVLQFVTRTYLIERLRLSTERQGLQRAEVAQKAVEDFAYFQRAEPTGQAPVTDAALVWVASLIRNDVDLFEGGEISASSKRELYASRLLGSRVSGPVYRALVLEGEPSVIRTERIGGFSYLVASMPVRLGRAEPAILSIPLALRQREVQSIVEDLDRTIRLASLLFLAGAALLAHRMARRISDPLRALTAATERIARGDLEARVSVRSRDELRQLVESFNRMAVDLDHQRRDLERSNRLAAWAEMARQVAHEVKNPLTPIQLSAQHLRRVFDDPSVDFRAALETCTTTILDQVRKLRQIATEFSSFARPPGADRSLASLPDVVRETLAPYAAGLPAGVSLDLHVNGGVPPVRVDRRLLGRAVVNLIENALQAIGDSGRIRVTVRGRGGRAEVEVADSGPGIEPAVRERMFEPFFSTKSSGSGLGLALVKKILEDHGGGVELSSEPGQGTTIVLWLSADEDPTGTAATTTNGRS